MGSGTVVVKKVGVALAWSVNLFTQAVGWHTVHKKCEPVLGGNYLDAESSWCSLLIETMVKWVDKSVCVR